MVFVFWSICWIAFLCEFAELITNRFNMFSDELWQCDWYSFPIDVQRSLIIVILNTNVPTILHGSAGAVCTREAFKMVFHLKRFEIHMRIYHWIYILISDDKFWVLLLHGFASTCWINIKYYYNHNNWLLLWNNSHPLASELNSMFKK